MPKHSNFNLVRIKRPNIDHRKTIINSINSTLSAQHKIDKRFAFQTENGRVITFNISKYRGTQVSLTAGYAHRYKIFRKKDNNVFYQVNTISKIIKIQNNGRYDKDFIIDWSKYNNSLITSTEDGLNIDKLTFNGYIFFNEVQK